MEAQLSRPWGECGGGSPGPPHPGGGAGEVRWGRAALCACDKEAAAAPPPRREKKAAFVAKKNPKNLGCEKGLSLRRGGKLRARGDGPPGTAVNRRGRYRRSSAPPAAAPARSTKPPRSPGAAVRPVARALRPEEAERRRASGQPLPGVWRCPLRGGEALPAGGFSLALLVMEGGVRPLPQRVAGKSEPCRAERA